MTHGRPHPAVQRRWVRRAEKVRDAFGLVLIMVIATYVLASIVSDEGWGAVALTTITAATAVMAMTSSHARGVMVKRTLEVSGLAILLALISAIAGGRAWISASSVLVIGLLVVAMGSVLRRVVSSREVSSRTILGAISVYAALGILFTWVYATIDRMEGGGFFGPGPIEHSDFIFFSYTTLTTTGYGDLIPAGQVGRMVSGLEMMLGQVFLVTLVAGLVSLWRPGQGIMRKRERRAESGEAE